jgi:O-antigen ligase
VSFVRGFDLITGTENSRITGLVNSATYHAHGNAVLFVILIGCLYFSYHRLSSLWKVISLVSTTLLGMSIYLTYTRGIWISIFVSSALMLFYLDPKKLVKLCILTVVVFFCALQFSPKLQERVQQTTTLLTSNEERVSLLKVNLQIWREYPLFGIGYGENLRRNREYWDRPEWNKPADYITSHAHNQFVNVLSTTGVFGFFFFCAFYFYFFYKNVKLIQKSRTEKRTESYAILMTCLWAQLEFFFACFTDVSFEYAKIRALLILVWAFLAAWQAHPQLIEDPIKEPLS